MNAKGKSVAPSAPDACGFSASGAIYRATAEVVFERTDLGFMTNWDRIEIFRFSDQVERSLGEALRVRYPNHPYLSDFNCSLSTRFEDLLGLFDHARERFARTPFRFVPDLRPTP